MKIVALITAREGSKRIPEKNLKKVNGITLLQRTINSAKEARTIDTIYLSTDSTMIGKAAERDCVIINRPKELASDTASTLAVMKHALHIIQKREGSDICLVLLQPTSPFRKGETIDRCVEELIDHKADVVLTGSRRELEPKWIMKKNPDRSCDFIENNDFHKIRSQDQDQYFDINGCVYCYTPKVIEDSEKYAMGNRVFVVPTTFLESFQIDEPEDLIIANRLAQAGTELFRSLSFGPPYVIAEAGVNHNGSMELAKQLVDAAADAGADAVKFQTYKTEDLVTKESETAEYQQKNTGKQESQFDMLKSLELAYDDFKELKEYCDRKGIQFLSTAHTMSAIDLIDPFVPFFKVGSGDLTNIPYLEALAERGKPIILSTGMGTLEEVKEAVEAIKKRNQEIVLLHCTTNYPCPEKDANLRVMQTLRDEFNLPVGYSDHTEGIKIPLMAASLGAKVIEKHFTIDRSLPGPDHKASLEPDELKEMISKMKQKQHLDIPESILGSPEKLPTKEENEIAKVARKSIITKKQIKKGQVLAKEDLIIKRPGTGISPKEYDNILGMRATKDLDEDTVLSWNDVE